MTSTDKKAKARERMAATGENYTTALRAIDKALAFTRELSFLDMLAHLQVSDPETDPHGRDTEISPDELARLQAYVTEHADDPAVVRLSSIPPSIESVYSLCDQVCISMGDPADGVACFLRNQPG